MRILFIVDDYSGGAGNVVQLLANQFICRNNEVDVILLNHHTINNKLNERVNVIEKVLTKDDSVNKIRWLFRAVNEINQEIRLLKPQVVISFLTNNNILVGLAMMFINTPLIVSERSNPIVIKPNMFWRLLRVFAYSRANTVVVQCSNFANFNKLFSKKTQVVPNPIIRPEVSVNNKEKRKVVRLTSVGRLAKIKQYDVMIKAFKLINEEWPNSELYIYGEGSERKNLEKLIFDLELENTVFLLGKTEEVYRALGNSDIYLMTSLQEGFPNALGEAMAIGLPVVAFECHEGLRDIIDNGINGILVTPGNIKEIVDQVSLLIEKKELREEYSKQAIKITEKYSLEKVVNMWEEILNSYVGDNQ